ncbi:hypothetical protein ACHHYP_11194 [Achlya hypogyna]|uniref:Uncharacterized protein n=1 Tax=Achlya hypogyna TaxID=1202772 RepID=A0A1V9YJL9_ACHHY|nr:hypothetical protein ACHHYP_11194 [Achlya hypogyna]
MTSSDENDLATKRLVKRDKQRDFRRKVASQLSFLRDRVGELEATLTTLKRDKAMTLSWLDIAKAMKQDIKCVERTKKKLRTSVQDQTIFLESMVKWVQSLYPNTERPPNSYPLWYNVGLCGSDVSRRAALEWITLHMYHHTPTVLHLAGFHPDNRAPSQEFVFDTSKGYNEYIYTDRRFIPASLSRVFAAYKHLYHTNTVEFVVAGRKVLDQKLLGEGMIYSRRKSKKDGSVHREFVSENRIVHVQHSVHDDNKHPLSSLHRHRTTWIVLDAVAPDLVMETRFFHKSQAWTRERGYVPLEEEAELTGYFSEYRAAVDREDFSMLPLSVQEDQLRHHMAKTYPRCMKTLNYELDQVLREHAAREATTAKRVLKRNRQRDFRRKVNQQLEFLRSRVVEFESDLAARKRARPTLLPWSHVERAMRQDLIECQEANKDLNNSVRSQQALNHAMFKWLQFVYQQLERGSVEHPTWFRRMFYHTDTVLQLAGFHPEDQTPMREFVFDSSKGYVEYIYRDRCIHYVSLDKILTAYRRLFHSSLILSKDYIYSRNYTFNDSLVHREFVSDNRVVFFEHSIHDNPKHSPSEYHRHKANWVVLDVIAPNVVMETKVFQKSQMWTKTNGYVSILEEAKLVQTRPTEAILKEHLGEAFMDHMFTVNEELQTFMLLLDLNDNLKAK